ncbi:MAG TPA: hypothetical protein VKT32_09060, partial [Chthonomonadaceae bacterium]|nr:hypothetical protein [Chthonomonadaceae bacterium]
MYLWYWPAGGWDFEAWKAEHAWEPITSPQSGRVDLLPPAPKGATLETWGAAREDWLRIVEALLGTVSD